MNGEDGSAIESYTYLGSDTVISLSRPMLGGDTLSMTDILDQFRWVADRSGCNSRAAFTLTRITSSTAKTAG